MADSRLLVALISLAAEEPFEGPWRRGRVVRFSQVAVLAVGIAGDLILDVAAPIRTKVDLASGPGGRGGGL